MPNQADDIEKGDIVVIDRESFGDPSWIADASLQYRVSSVTKRTEFPNRDRDVVYIENLDGSPAKRGPWDTPGSGISILWFYKYKRPTNAERIEERRKAHVQVS